MRCDILGPLFVRCRTCNRIHKGKRHFACSKCEKTFSQSLLFIVYCLLCILVSLIAIAIIFGKFKRIVAHTLSLRNYWSEILWIPPPCLLACSLGFALLKVLFHEFDHGSLRISVSLVISNNLLFNFPADWPPHPRPTW